MLFKIISIVSFAIIFTSFAKAEESPPPAHTKPYFKKSEKFDSLLEGNIALIRPGGEGFPNQSTVRETELIEEPGAEWLQIHFGQYNFGERSYIEITSMKDGQVQKLDSISLQQWSNSTGIFNGDSVEIKLYVAPGETGIFYNIKELTVGETEKEAVTQFPDSTERNSGRAIETICGDEDDRTPSTNAAVGRLFRGGCTAWLISNGALLTAGHCVDFDPDRGGSRLPDGQLDLDGVVEFNVPSSRVPNGQTVAAAIDDQYPIDLDSVVWNFDGSGQGIGKDWAIFTVQPNSNTNLWPHLAQAVFFRLTNAVPTTNVGNIRITGYGRDTEPERDYTQQTHNGPYEGETTEGADAFHEYRVDTRGANSGSPIILEESNMAIGIHTNGGCTDSGGENAGTSFNHVPLETAIQNFSGNNVIYVDSGHPVRSTDSDGTIFRPFHSLAKAINVIQHGGVLSVVRGTYSGKYTMDKPLTIHAPVGAVVIGR